MIIDYPEWRSTVSGAARRRRVRDSVFCPPRKRISQERIFFIAELPKGLTRKIGCRSLRDILIAQPDLLEQRVVLRV